MHNCPLLAPKQTSARIDFLRQGERLVDKNGTHNVKILTESWTKRLCCMHARVGNGTANTCACYRQCKRLQGMLPRPTETTPCKRRSNLPLAAWHPTCRERMEQLSPSRLLKHGPVLSQTNGATFQISSHLHPVLCA